MHVDMSVYCSSVLSSVTSYHIVPSVCALLSLYVGQCVRTFIFPPVQPYDRPIYSICPHVCLSVCVCICSCLSLCPFSFPSVHLSVSRPYMWTCVRACGYMFQCRLYVMDTGRDILYVFQTVPSYECPSFK